MYEVIKVSGGYKVRKASGERTRTGRKYFSNKPLSKKQAHAQMRALYANENRIVKSPIRKVKMSPKRVAKPGSPKRVTKPGSPKRVTKKLSPRRKRRTLSPRRR